MTMYKELRSLQIRCEKWADTLSKGFSIQDGFRLGYLTTINRTGKTDGNIPNVYPFRYSISIAKDLNQILKKYANDSIDIELLVRIKEIVEQILDCEKITERGNVSHPLGVTARLQMLFGTLDGELTALLDTFDVEIQQSLLVERAFEYIQAMIVASDTTWCDWVQFDPTTNKPQIANEITCERLGAASLLLSGIWAVKVGTTGKITDLFLPLNEEEHEVDVSHALRTGSFFVLTEWKVATSEDFKDKVRQAQSQADIYKGDSLGSFQVNGKTYLVICTLECLTHLALEMESELNEEFGEGRYRVINLYASTDSASVISKAQAAHKKRQILTIKKQDKSKT